MTMTRKQFLKSVLGVGVGAVGVAAIAGCGGDDGGGGTTVDAANVCTSPATNIASNHGHTINVSLADVDAAANKTYDISGSGGHAHSVTITAAQFAQIKSGRTLTIESTSGGGHTHSVTVMCVS
ncbi:MAG: hypothetical protein SFX73_10855 [Kofleriaceae bacterium]|nr:hypothetical protein [Kofleriaceae bacterium]